MMATLTIPTDNAQSLYLFRARCGHLEERWGRHEDVERRRGEIARAIAGLDCSDCHREQLRLGRVRP